MPTLMHLFQAVVGSPRWCLRLEAPIANIVKYLLDNGADVNAVDSDGKQFLITLQKEMMKRLMLCLSDSFYLRFSSLDVPL